MSIFQRAGMKEGELPLPLAFQYFIFMIWRSCGLDLVMISLLASKCQDFKLRGLQFHFIKRWKIIIPTLKTCCFEASEDIITKFKSQALHILKIKYWKASGSGNPPFFISALRKIAISGIKTKFYVFFGTRLYLLQKETSVFSNNNFTQVCWFFLKNFAL